MRTVFAGVCAAVLGVLFVAVFAVLFTAGLLVGGRGPFPCPRT